MKKVVLITGSSRGIGRALAIVFMRNGYDVIIHGRNKKELESVRSYISASGKKCYIVVGDINESGTIKKLYDAFKKFKASILINNAGIPGRGPIQKISNQQIDKIIKTNLIAPIKLIKKIYPNLVKKRNGVIININSISGLEFKSQSPIYCASKWGLRGFTGSLREEASKFNVRIIDVFPSRVKTRAEFIYGMEPKDLAEKIYRFFKNAKKNILIVDERPLKYRKYIM